MKKSKKVKIIFIILSVFFVVLFFVLFFISKNIKSLYDTYLGQYNAAKLTNNEEEMVTAEALMNSQYLIYTIMSLSCYFSSLVGIICVGLGLKLVDKYKTQEEESENLKVFVDKTQENKDKDALESLLADTKDE